MIDFGAFRGIQVNMKEVGRFGEEGEIDLAEQFEKTFADTDGILLNESALNKIAERITQLSTELLQKGGTWS
jgi:hypothetical protein